MILINTYLRIKFDFTFISVLEFGVFGKVIIIVYMKKLFRSYVINLGAILITTHFITALVLNQGVKGALLAALVFMIANGLLSLIFKIILLPLNLLTLGLFAWVGNILALYVLVSFLPLFTVSPYFFPGIASAQISLPATQLTTFETAVLSSFILAFIIHFFHWFID